MLSQRIKEVRNTLRLSQTAFDEKVGVSIHVIKNIELNRATPNELLISHICSVYGINEHWLRTGEGEMFSGKSEDDIAIESALRNTSGSPALRAFLVAYSKLNDQNRAILEQFVADYVEEYRSAVVAENIKKDAAVFGNIIPNPHFVSVPMKDVAVQDGTFEAKHAAMQEQKELQGESYPLPDDFSYKPFAHDPDDDVKIVR